IGENTTINATVKNPLPLTDRMKVVFKGSAVQKGLIETDFPSGISCNEQNLECELTVPAESEEKITIDVTATAIGQGTLVGTVNSTTTQLSSTDRLEVRVKPLFAPVTVSAPGIKEFQLLILALAGSLLVGILRKKDLKQVKS
ncbi:MAG: hypothetical protein ABEI07_00985, partial [Candidatus Nanohaloarchaea archaeon]